jgi:hypothetical protein
VILDIRTLPWQYTPFKRLSIKITPEAKLYAKAALMDSERQNLSESGRSGLLPSAHAALPTAKLVTGTLVDTVTSISCPAVRDVRNSIHESCHFPFSQNVKLV